MNIFDRLSQFSIKGNWSGEAITYLQPDVVSAKGTMSLNISPVFDNDFIRFSYQHEMDGTSYNGEMLLGYNSGHQQYQMSWIDQYHMQSGIMFLRGKENDPILYGEYSGNSETWGWKIELIIDETDLTIKHFNINPSGEEYLGVEMKLVGD